MSSTAFSAVLVPDRTLRRIVLLSGLTLMCIGIVLILKLPLHPAILATGTIAWLLLCASELRNLARGFQRCRLLRVTANGAIRLLDANGDWRAAELLPGSLLLRRIGWIRVSDSAGRTSVEPVRGHCRESQDWRRFQVIWRHIGSGWVKLLPSSGRDSSRDSSRDRNTVTKQR